MHLIKTEQVRNWGEVKKLAAPKSVSSYCPHCTATVTFTLVKHQADENRRCITSTSACPCCNQEVHFFCISSDEGNKTFMYPEGNPPRAPRQLKETLPTPLYNAYKSTVDSFSSNNHVATAVCARRTLEGLFLELLKKNSNNLSLSELITKAASEIDLSEPIRNLANVLRKGGNLGAHFNADIEPTEEISLKMLELLENLIDYLYILPRSINDLETQIEK